MNCLYCGKDTTLFQLHGETLIVPPNSAHPFCNNHYFAIPQRLRRFLYNNKSAWQAALEWLEDKYGKRENNANQGQ